MFKIVRNQKKVTTSNSTAIPLAYTLPRGMFGNIPSPSAADLQAIETHVVYLMLGLKADHRVASRVARLVTRYADTDTGARIEKIQSGIKANAKLVFNGRNVTLVFTTK